MQLAFGPKAIDPLADFFYEGVDGLDTVVLIWVWKESFLDRLEVHVFLDESAVHECAVTGRILGGDHRGIVQLGPEMCSLATRVFIEKSDEPCQRATKPLVNLRLGTNSFQIV